MNPLDDSPHERLDQLLQRYSQRRSGGSIGRDTRENTTGGNATTRSSSTTEVNSVATFAETDNISGWAELGSVSDLSDQDTAPQGVITSNEIELYSLVSLARTFQAAPQIQPTATFSTQLERRLLRRNAELRLQHGTPRRMLSAWVRFHPAWSGLLGVLLSCLFLGSGFLAYAAQVKNPSNPFYNVRQWENTVKASLSNNPQTTIINNELQYAQEQLDSLSGLTDQSHHDDYDQALHTMDQHLNMASQDIAQLPAGTQHDQLMAKLATQKSLTISTLRGLLTHLAVTQEISTTNELGNLGDTIPVLHDAKLQNNEKHSTSTQSILVITGTGIQEGAILLINGHSTGITGTLQNGQITFTVSQDYLEHARSVGILNPDHTAAQITTSFDKNNDSGNDGSNKNGNYGPGNGTATGTATPSASKTPGENCQPTVEPTQTPQRH